MQYRIFDKGLTVAELKKLIADWPDTREDGEPCEVWMVDDKGLSNVVRVVVPLNMREDDGHHEADLMFGWHTA